MKRFYPAIFSVAIAASTIFAVRAQDEVSSRPTLAIVSVDSNQPNLGQEDHRLRNATMSLMQKYRKATSEQKTALEKQLRDVVTQHFKVRQQIRDQEIVKLTERLNELKDVQQRRQNQSEKIVDDQLQHLIREASGLGWGSNSQVPEFNFVPDVVDAQAFYIESNVADPSISADSSSVRP